MVTKFLLLIIGIHEFSAILTTLHLLCKMLCMLLSLTVATVIWYILNVEYFDLQVRMKLVNLGHAQRLVFFPSVYWPGYFLMIQPSLYF